MTPIRRLPAAIGARRTNTLDQEREQSEKVQVNRAIIAPLCKFIFGKLWSYTLTGQSS